MGDITRLPKWAREELTFLRRDRVERWQKEEQRRVNAKTALKCEDGGYGFPPVYLDPRWGRMRLQLGENYNEFIEVSILDGVSGIEVHGGMQLAVLPNVNNSIRIKLFDRDRVEGSVG